ncbi:MAG: hypothetical protein WD208_02895 [Dehalococcoidia bacterium]
MVDRATGIVEALKLSTFRGFAEVRRTDGELPAVAIFIIWFRDESHGPAALYTSELTTAMARRLEVTVVTEDDSAFIEDLTIHAPAGDGTAPG